MAAGVGLARVATTGAAVASWTCGNQEICGVAFSPDNAMLATCGQDRDVWLWNTGNWKPIGALNGHRRTVQRVVFAPDGKTIASCDRDGVIKLWDSRAQRLQRSWQAHDGVAQALAWSSNSDTIASCGSDSQVILWNSATGERRDTFVCPFGPKLLAVAFHPDGKSIYASGYSQFIHSWNLANHNPNHFVARTSTIFALAFGLDNVLLASGKNDRFVIWPGNNHTDETSPLRCLDYSTTPLRCVVPIPKSREFILVDDSGGIQRWDTNTILLDAKDNQHGIVVRISRDGSRSVYSHLGGRLRFDVHNKLRFMAAGQIGPVRRGVFSFDNKRFAYLDADGLVRVWDVIERKIVLSIKRNLRERNCLSLDRTGERLAVCTQQNELEVWKIGDKLPYFTAKGSGAYFVGDEGTLAYFAPNADVIHLMDAANAKVHRQVPTRPGVDLLAFTPDAKTLMNCGWEGSVDFWEVATGKLLGRHREATSNAFADIAVSPDGQTVATLAKNGLIRLWNVRFHQELFVLRRESPGGADRFIRFRKDGSLMAAEPQDTLQTSLTEWPTEASK